MKKLCTVVAVLGMFALAACGGGDNNGGGGTEQDAINNSVAAFRAIESNVEDNFGAVCVLKALWDCNEACQVGSLEYDDVQDKAILNSCEHTDGSTFTGTVQYNDALGTMDLDLSLFGDCTYVKGTITGAEEENCQGTVTATCAGEDITCEMESSCETCTITSGGGGTTTNAALVAALEGFESTVPPLQDIPTECTDLGLGVYSCDCTGGGTVEIEGLDLTHASCVESGLTYTGNSTTTHDLVDNENIVTYDYSVFGACSDATGTLTLSLGGDGGCSGSITATCPDPSTQGATETATCNFGVVGTECQCT